MPTNDNPLRFPATTLYGHAVPKAAFYRNMEVGGKLRARFTDDIERMVWLYKLAPTTLSVADGATVHEIVVFLAELKAEDVPDDIFTAIDRQMPRHTLFLLRYGGRLRLLLGYKQWHDAAQTSFDIVRTFRTPWLCPGDIGLQLNGHTMDDIYEGFAGQVSGLGTTTRRATAEAIALTKAIEQQRREAEALRRRLRNERQYGRQFELHQRLREAERKTAEMEARLRQIAPASGGQEKPE